MDVLARYLQPAIIFINDYPVYESQSSTSLGIATVDVDNCTLVGPVFEAALCRRGAVKDVFDYLDSLPNGAMIVGLIHYCISDILFWDEWEERFGFLLHPMAHTYPIRMKVG